LINEAEATLMMGSVSAFFLYADSYFCLPRHMIKYIAILYGAGELMENSNIVSCRWKNIIIYFIIYSFVGWCMETAYAFFSQGRFVNRGFLYGPFCPVYGFGALILIILLKPVKHNILLMFTGSAILTSILEYITGFLLETAFDRTWWDYSNEPLNLHGRICLRNSLLWGMFALLFIYVLHPAIKRIVRLIPKNIKTVTVYLITFYIIFDTFMVTYSLTSSGADSNPVYRILGGIYSGLDHIKAMILK
jgi:hypothetical protein